MLPEGRGSVPLELRLEVKPQSCLLHDVDGRSMQFDALVPGESCYSPSEDLWLLRSGGDEADGPQWFASTEQRRFAHLSARYTKQFTSMDSLVAQMQSTSNYLSQQLSALSK